MSTQRVQLVNDGIYHVVFRAVGDAMIFKNKHDYYRGIFSLDLLIKGFRDEMVRFQNENLIEF